MLFKHSSIYILAKLIPGLMAFAALSIYTHLLSPGEYGLYTLLFTGVVFLHNVLFNWLPAGTLRYWSNTKHTQSEFTNTLAISYLRIITLILLLALIGVGFKWGTQQVFWILSAFLFLISLAIFTITQSIYNASIQPINYAYLSISYSILALVFGTLLAYFGYGATGVIFGIALGTCTPALFAFKKIWLPFNGKAFNPSLFNKILIYGLPLAAAALVEEITKITDRFMLAGINGKADAGLYAVGYDLSGNSILMIMAAINVAAYPVIIKLLDTEGVKAATDYFRHYVILLMAVSIPAVIGLNMVGPNLVHLLIDVAYQESVLFLLPWITLAIFLMGLQVFYFDLAFQLGQKTIASVKIAIVISIVNVGLNYKLIPDMGIHGAAIATLSSFAVGCVLSAFFGKKYFSLPFPIVEIIKIITSTFIMFICLWYLRHYQGWGWLMLQLMIGLLSFSSIMIFLNVLNSRDYLSVFLKKPL